MSALGRTEMAKKSIPEQVTSRSRRPSEMGIASQHCPAAMSSLNSRAASRFVLALLLAAVFLVGGCGNTDPAATIPTPVVEVQRGPERRPDFQRMGGDARWLRERA